jgi:hypothetical protein
LLIADLLSSGDVRYFVPETNVEKGGTKRNSENVEFSQRKLRDSSGILSTVCLITSRETKFLM